MRQLSISRPLPFTRNISGYGGEWMFASLGELQGTDGHHTLLIGNDEES